MGERRFATIGFDLTKFNKRQAEKRMHQNATECNASATEEDTGHTEPSQDLIIPEEPGKQEIHTNEEPESPGAQPKEESEIPHVEDTLAQLAVPDHDNEMPEKDFNALIAKTFSALAHELVFGLLA